MEKQTPSYAVLGSTGNCGLALIDNLLRTPHVKINAYCRNRSKLERLLPPAQKNGPLEIFEGSSTNTAIIASCVRGCRAVFLVVSTNDNVPNCTMSQDITRTVIEALRAIRKQEPTTAMPKLVLLSSSTIDEYLSRDVPAFFHQVLRRSGSHVYADIHKAENMIRAEEKWLTGIYIKPGALSVDLQRGHALSLTNQESPISYLDLAAAMIEAADDPTGQFDSRNVGVVNTNGAASFPSGTPLCILLGLLRHYFPYLHPYLPTTSGPK